MKPEITQEMVDAFGRAWDAQDKLERSGQVDGDWGSRRRAGLAAFLAELEKTHRVLPKSTAPEGVVLDLDAIEDKWLQPCPVCDAGLPGDCTHPDADYRPVMMDLIYAVEKAWTLANRVNMTSDHGSIFVVAHLLDRLGVSEILVSNEDLEREDHRTVTVYQDFLTDGWVIKVSKEPKP